LWRRRAGVKCEVERESDEERVCRPSPTAGDEVHTAPPRARRALSTALAAVFPESHLRLGHRDNPTWPGLRADPRRDACPQLCAALRRNDALAWYVSAEVGHRKGKV
jgi:hypothetical protein